ncbi:MAG: nicotinate-nucleotide adenylyltransferase, partial [Dehalococcoidia bacterium]|nr:nicotinate-nucleotide adenylyltransferase [Dehalococcoidia bacterium]
IGVLGGTFDPIHMGHLVVAEEARTKLGLSEVLFVPAGQPWLKQDHSITTAAHRVEMVRRAIADNPFFKLNTLEVDRPGPSYTVDTLKLLQDQLGSEASFFFILGRDTLAELPLWKEPRRVLQLCRLVVPPRLGSRDLRHLEEAIPGLLERVIQLDMPVIGISSSEIRQRIARRLSIHYLVPAEVEQYIAEQKIYPVSVS